MSRAEKCPVCNGEGKYKGKTCHGCNGRGWILIPGDTYSPRKRNPWEPPPYMTGARFGEPKKSKNRMVAQ